ncbi:asparagine synthase-related protein [Sphingomonas faeni]|uniref:asparagine synthase-related protein n=1 Tax=Sphingomonas faeni TaxID=185950 RepID=UPI0020C7DB6B|nr:asparagine synthase C-terminal domain-containing protein [Sphingomonas faeni]MCP8893176.1 asparagine synthase C-terminal domain-containing protein [Sphingomonas faeni]
MTGFIAYRWRVDDPPADQLAARLRTVALDQGWQAVQDGPGWAVLAQAAPGPAYASKVVDDHTVVIGSVFDRTATEQGRVADGVVPDGSQDFAMLCDHLTTRCWGAYVALQIEPDDRSSLDIFRDPVGMLDCVIWQCGGMHIVTSMPEPFIAHAPPVGLAIDWLRAAALLRFPGSVGDALPLVGVEAVPSGVRLALAGNTRRTTYLWTPAEFARRPVPPAPPALPAMIDACIGAWHSRTGIAIAEVSGGLDSGIVAAGLTRSGRDVAGWFHYHAIDRDGDERVYARAVAAHLGLPLHETLQDHRVVDAALMADVPVTLRPNVASLSVFHDRDLAARGRALGADTLLTGQGGDALFFQPATPLIAADLWRDPRPWRAKAATIADLAGWTGRSIWSVLGTVLRARIAPSAVALPDYRVDLVARDMPRDDHPLRWLDDTAALAPAKQLQILTLAAGRAAFGGSWCASAMTVRHPLMSQPLLEHVLPIPALDLTQGKRDRAMIRQAYAGRLPPILLERRGKGCLTPFFGRMLAASMPFLRDYLIGGVLDRHHVLDRETLAMVLDPEHVMRTNCYTEIFVVLLMERWARAWCDRIAAIDAARA